MRGSNPADAAGIPGSLWTPALLGPSVLSFWVKARDYAFTTASGNVSQWNDKSRQANHLTQATAGSRPALRPIGAVSNSGLPSVNFDGGDQLDFTASVDWTDAAGNSGYAVAEQNGAGTTRAIFGRGDGAASGAVQLRYETTGAIQFIRNFQAGLVTSSNTAGTGLHICGFSGRVNFSQVSLDGTVTSNGTNPGIFAGATFGWNVLGQSRAAEFFTGDICEALGTKRMLERWESDLVEGYLAWEHRLPDRLPASHPYKKGPPLVGGLRLRQPAVYLAAGGAVNGALNVTIAPVTQSANGTLPIQATAAQTIAPVTLAASSAVIIQGSFGQTIGPVIQSATGALIIKGTFGQTIDPVTLVASGAANIPPPSTEYRHSGQMVSMGRMMNR